MSLTALALLLFAAVLHATWNLLLKQVEDKYLVTWWAMLVGFVCCLPLIFIGRPLPTRVWPYAVSSAVAEAAYFGTLTTAYRHGDFSVVYPIARGAAPAFLAVWSVLFLQESPRAAGAAGLVILVIGLMVVGSSAWWRTRRQPGHSTSGIGLALLVAFFISLYSAIDGAAVQFADPASYTVLIFGLMVALVAPFIIKRFGWRAVVIAGHLHWLRIGLIGCLTLVSYMMVLAAYARSPVSYAGAIREMSVVFGALAGWRWLGEGFGAIRAIGAVIIFCGILLITVAG